MQKPRPAAEVNAFVDKGSTNDAVVEIIVGQSRILTLKEELKGAGGPLIAVGDPSVMNFTIVNTRQLRLVGERIGVTDLSVVTADNRTYHFEVQVVADLDPLRLRLRQTFPNAQLKLTAVRDHVVLEGEARDSPQVARIMDTVRAYLDSVYASELRKIRQTQAVTPPARPAGGGQQPDTPPPSKPTPNGPGGEILPPGAPVSPEQAPPTSIEATVLRPQIINLIRIPGPQQVLLKVRIAELDRTAMRQIGADFLAGDPSTGVIVGSQIGGASVTARADMVGGSLLGAASNAAASQTTLFGIFERADLDIILSALRRNSILKVLAEPNLITMNGHKAHFLAGGKFPVPVPQAVSGGVGATVTVQFEPFGVTLDFLPFVLDDDRIRLTVHPQVSSIDFTIGTVLVPGGTLVPGLNSREANTTVELQQGETLAIAGLLQLTLAGQTDRIPGLGDLPILGPFFSNTTNSRVEKELIVLVTPFLVEPMKQCQVSPVPGDEVKEPNDLEFFLLNRIEGRTGWDFRSTVQYDDALHLLRCFMKLEKEHVRGPHGFSQ
jgi:pilus assembly protein CpaC